MELDPATAAYRKYGYNDRPVEARLGPHRFRIPANYFRDQIGPDFQGNWSLLVQWPDLEPLPPGKRGGQDMETFNKQITISPNDVDQVPIEGLLEKAVRPHVSETSPSYADPRERLDLRREQPQVHGLTPYWIDREALGAYAAERTREDGRPYPLLPHLEDDWYLGRDAQGRLTTVIKCTSHDQPDGLIVEGARVKADDTPRTAGCTHEFVMKQERISVSLDYARVFLPDWKRIEARARDLLTRYRVD